jgi:hypothetical protein
VRKQKQHQNSPSSQKQVEETEDSWDDSLTKEVEGNEASDDSQRRSEVEGTEDSMTVNDVVVLGRNENSLVRVLAGRIRCFFAIDVF